MLILKPKTFNSKTPCQMHDEQSDLLILMGSSIIPVHSNILANYSPFFQNMHSQNSSCQHRVQIITSPLQTETVISVFKYHYGHQLSIPRNEQLKNFMEVVTFFGFRSLRDQLLNDLMKNFEKYDLFFMLQFAKEFGLEKLEELCWRELEKQDYQQTGKYKESFECCQEALCLEILQKKTQYQKIISQKEGKTVSRSKDSNNCDLVGNLFRKWLEWSLQSAGLRNENSQFFQNLEFLCQIKNGLQSFSDRPTESKMTYRAYPQTLDQANFFSLKLIDQSVEINRKHILFDQEYKREPIS